MPRLGGTAMAYSPYPSHSRFRVWEILGVCFVGLLLYNTLFHDYRGDAMGQLAATGKTPEEISRYIPPTATERRQRLRDSSTELQLLHEEVANLRRDVTALQNTVRLFQTNETQRHDEDEARLEMSAKGRLLPLSEGEGKKTSD